ncbi:MAG: Uma2 family endonuclease [Hyphomonadaceae bacterium]|nr:Uma2 family endonuclease [Hyphomonadaceae bacterium]
MNAPLKPTPSPAFAPAVFTDDEFEDFLGLPGIEKLGRFELRDGVIYRMNAQYMPHMRVKMALVLALQAAIVRAALDFEVGSEGSVRFGGGFMPLPDLFVWRPVPDAKKTAPGEHVVLAVEVSDSTFKDDHGDKLPRYAKAGLAELWIAEIPKRTIHLFADPHEKTYRRAEQVSFGAAFDALTIPGLRIETEALDRF